MSPTPSTKDSKPSRTARLHLFLLAVACVAFLAAAPGRPASAAPLVGANLDLAGLPPERQAAELDRLAQAGARSVRFALDWNRVQPKPDRFDWGADDVAVDVALARGLEVLLVLGPCAEWAVDPKWKVPPDQRRRSVPKSMRPWQRYVREAVSHFRGRVRCWQIREQPNIRNFRGARREYLRLLEAAAREARAVDPSARIIVPEAGSLDIAAVDRLLQSNACQYCSVLGVYLPGKAGDYYRVLLPWAVLTHEVLPGADPAKRRPVWVLGGGQLLPADVWLAHYLLAWAFGAERCYFPSDSISPEWVGPLGDLQYAGFIRVGPGIWALVFDAPQGPAVIAWSLTEIEIAAPDIAPVADQQAVLQAAPLGRLPGSAVVPGADPVALRIGPRPVLILGLDPDAAMTRGAPARRDILSARAAPDLGQVPSVYADYSMADQPEFGLYNRSVRTLSGGNIAEEEHAGRNCLRTKMTYRTGEEEKDNPWIYFDVDDSWLYLDRGRTRLAITVECAGSYLGEQKLGFNIMYDSTRGYRFTRWQWVDPGYGWHTYRVELNDASFANRDGYDFRINAKGSKQDLCVASVTVEKLPTTLASGAPQAASPE